MSLLAQTERELALTEEIAHKFDIKGAERADTESGVSGNGEIAEIAGIAAGEPELLRRPVPPPKAYPVDSSSITTRKIRRCVDARPRRPNRMRVQMTPADSTVK